MNMASRYFELRRARGMDHRTAAIALRRGIRDGTDPEQLLILAVRAYETAPPEMEPTFERYLSALASGRRVKISVFSAHIIPLDPTDDLVEAIEDIFKELEQ